MILKTLKLRIEHLNLVTNCYVVMDEETKEAMVIDPGAESQKIIEMVDDDDLIHLGNLEFRVIATPGHTKGGLCLYCPAEEMIFTGDTIFSSTWGRTDLPTGSIEDIMDSIINKILVLPNNTIMYPGHGKSTLIKEEKPIYLELRKKDF